MLSAVINTVAELKPNFLSGWPLSHVMPLSSTTALVESQCIVGTEHPTESGPNYDQVGNF